MLRRLTLRDVAIVAELELDFGEGFGALTGETGAGKSILIDALQLALGQRGDATLVREGATRAEVSAEFDLPESLLPWLQEGGFEPQGADPGTLLLRRSLDAQGRSRAWVNGSPATLAQLRQAADELVDIHGQHAWQSLTRPAAVRALLDEQAGVDLTELRQAWGVWRAAVQTLDDARQRQASLAQERERLSWQIAEVDKLRPLPGQWDSLNAEHQRLAHGQALVDGAMAAQAAIAEAEPSASGLTARALQALQAVQRWDAGLDDAVQALQSAQAQLDDAAHTLAAYLQRQELDPDQLAELDSRLAAWVSLARRFRCPPADLPALWEGWKDELARCEAAADLQALEAAAQAAQARWQTLAQQVSGQRRRAAPALARAVTQLMPSLGMEGGRLEVAVTPLPQPQADGLDEVELRVAGHAGSTPRPLAKVASGGELSRLALAIAVSTRTAQATGGASTLIFDEIDAGVGGRVGDSVGQLMRQLGQSRQVLAVTHLAQVAVCAHRHWVVSKSRQGAQTLSRVQPVDGEARVAEVARMLGGETHSARAHAAAMLAQAQAPVAAAGGETARAGRAAGTGRRAPGRPDPATSAAAPGATGAGR